ncbi:MAG TPA: hypothetical protein VJ860_15140 [Polyangia bacterium]|jgi:Predicted membrane protein (DUF2127).|nr:hypothetical protein [Polyangia bacterium]
MQVQPGVRAVAIYEGTKGILVLVVGLGLLASFTATCSSLPKMS